MSASEDAVSQSSKKRKHNRRRRFFRFFRFSHCNAKGQYKHDELAAGNGSSVEGLQVTSSLSGDSASLGMSSRADALTIGSMQSENAASAYGGASASTHSQVGESRYKPESASTEPTHLECPLCLNVQVSENYPRLMTCSHRSCIDCLRQYLMIEITESRVNVTCPECQERIHPVDMQLILKNSPNLIEKWEEFTLRRCLSVDPDCRWCPAPDCGFAVIAHGCASCPKLHCDKSGCNTDFCYHCRQEWHPNQTCDAAHLQRTKQFRLRSNSVAYSQGSSLNDQIKPCPKCGALIAKMNDGSCNHMTCTVCEAEFCWLCLQEISDLHYLSPSGCTFWGKKPWSRKKKILWQLGLLIGAPLGIGLVAGVAVPAIVIGLPIWVARQVMAQFANRTSSKHKRNSAVALCVMLSVVVSPLLAALAVGVGVPVMLLYVYGVVPFSLCRTGSYGISARNAAIRARSAMRIECGNPVVPAPSSGKVSYEVNSLPEPSANNGIRQTITNPSIGETSVGGLTMASLTESHASNNDRADGDGASTTAIAALKLRWNFPEHNTSNPLRIHPVKYHWVDQGIVIGASITGSITGSMAAFVEASSTRVKDNEPGTSLASNGINSAVTSVQVHMQDNVSVHSTSSYAPSSSSTASKSFSSKSLGAKRKSSKSGKIKAPRKSSVPKKISEQEESKISAESSTATTVMFTNHSDITASKSLAQSTIVNISNTSKTCKTVSKPVVIDIEKEPVSSTVTIKVFNDDTSCASDETSSCGSQNALLDGTKCKDSSGTTYTEEVPTVTNDECTSSKAGPE